MYMIQAFDWIAGQITLDEFIQGAQKSPWLQEFLRLDVNPSSWVQRYLCDRKLMGKDSWGTSEYPQTQSQKKERKKGLGSEHYCLIHMFHMEPNLMEKEQNCLNVVERSILRLFYCQCLLWLWLYAYDSNALQNSSLDTAGLHHITNCKHDKSVSGRFHKQRGVKFIIQSNTVTAAKCRKKSWWK